MKWVSLNTERLQIRTYTPDDIDAVYEIINDKQIYKMTQHMPHPYPKEQVEVWIKFVLKNIDYGNGIECGIFKGKQYIGNIGLVNLDFQNKNGELTYFIGTNHVGKGYATEAARAMCLYGFGILELERIQARCFNQNDASKRVMEKIGFSYEGIARKQVFKEEHYLDIYYASCLRTEVLNQAGF